MSLTTYTNNQLRPLRLMLSFGFWFAGGLFVIAGFSRASDGTSSGTLKVEMTAHTTQAADSLTQGSVESKDVIQAAVMSGRSTRATIVAKWAKVPGALGYRLDVSTNDKFDSFLPGYQNLDVGDVNGRLIAGLSPATSYYYRVRAYDGARVGEDSAVMAASTIATAGLTINPTFDSSVLNNPNAAAIEAAINQAISVEEALYSSAITISIAFRWTTTADPCGTLPANFLGQSCTSVYHDSWSNYVNALKQHEKSSNDLTANASLPSTAQSTYIYFSAANGRALGFNTPGGTLYNGGTFDATITLNPALQIARPTGANTFDTQTVTEHEIDEVMGLGSYLNCTVCSGNWRPQDLFSWSSPGNRNVSTTGARYFSINSGTANIVNFNQTSNNDYGDWATNCQHVQDAMGCQGQFFDVAAASPEAVNLDVIGYDLGTASAGGQELITNGGFESGSTGWFMAGPVVPSTCSYPHTGCGYVVLGEANNANDVMYQEFTIPATATQVSGSYWYSITSDETTTTTQFDKIFFQLRDTNSNLLFTIDQRSNLDKEPDGVPRYHQKTFDLTAYRGQRVRFYVNATTDSGLHTYYKMDDVSVIASLPSPTPTPTATATATPTATPRSTPTATATPTATPIVVTVQTNPSGRSFSVDGTTYTASKTFSWIAGQSHTIGTTSPQSGTSGTQYVWNGWSDNGAISHSVAPTTNTTYTASLKTQYLLTMSSSAGGAVTPASNWFDSGSTVQIDASVNTGFVFNAWSGAGTGGYSGPQNPVNITMNAPITETASFTQIGGPALPLASGAVIGLVSNANGMVVTAENAGKNPLIANRSAIGQWEQFQVLDQGNGYVALRSLADGLYVTAENAGASALIANRGSVGTWEQFQLVDAGGGKFAMIARADGLYVTAENGGSSSLIANRKAIGDWEKFSMVFLASGVPGNVTLGLQSLYPISNAYVSAESAGSAALVANRSQEGSWEQFRIEPQSNGNVAIRSLINGLFVTAENAGASALIANRNTVGTWEQFQLFDAGNGTVALRALANGLYVSAANTGNQLIANRFFVGSGEQFKLMISLRALANNKIVTAENAGAQSLIANRDAIGTWEQFQFISSNSVNNVSPGYFALKANANGMYVTAENAGNNPLIANRGAIGTWEQFQWVIGGNGNVVIKALANGLFVTAENAGASPLIANRSSAGTWEQFH